jgi:hypothetical protein
MAMGLFSLSRWRRAPTVFDAAMLPASGDVVVTGSDIGDERISAVRARAIADAVNRHDAAVLAGIVPASAVPQRQADVGGGESA